MGYTKITKPDEFVDLIMYMSLLFLCRSPKCNVFEHEFLHVCGLATSEDFFIFIENKNTPDLHSMLRHYKFDLACRLCDGNVSIFFSSEKGVLRRLCVYFTCVSRERLIE
jgi:hypothetical protein